MFYGRGWVGGKALLVPSFSGSRYGFWGCCCTCFVPGFPGLLVGCDEGFLPRSPQRAEELDASRIPVNRSKIRYPGLSRFGSPFVF